jgi:hypothetical protein
MSTTTSYIPKRRDPPPVIDLSNCLHKTFGDIWQKTEWVKHQLNLPHKVTHKYQTCKTCGFIKQVN